MTRIVEIDPDALAQVRHDVAATRDAVDDLGSLAWRMSNLGVSTGSAARGLASSSRLGSNVLPVLDTHVRRAQDLAALRYGGAFGAPIPVVDDFPDVFTPPSPFTQTAPVRRRHAPDLGRASQAEDRGRRGATPRSPAGSAAGSPTGGTTCPTPSPTAPTGSPTRPARPGTPSPTPGRPIGDWWETTTADLGAWIDTHLAGVREFIGRHVGGLPVPGRRPADRRLGRRGVGAVLAVALDDHRRHGRHRRRRHLRVRRRRRARRGGRRGRRAPRSA